MYFKKSTKDGYRRETWFEEMVVEPEVGEITITSSETGSSSRPLEQAPNKIGVCDRMLIEDDRCYPLLS